MNISRIEIFAARRTLFFIIYIYNNLMTSKLLHNNVHNI